jgi:hypothetical protein
MAGTTVRRRRTRRASRLLVALVVVFALLSVPRVDARTGPFRRFLADKCFGSEERCGLFNLGYVMRLVDENGKCTFYGCAYAPVLERAWLCGYGDCVK